MSISVIITFRNPYPLPNGKFDTSIPLDKWTSRILCIIDNPGNARMITVTLYNLPAVISRVIIKDNDFKVSKSLSQDTVKSLG